MRRTLREIPTTAVVSPTSPLRRPLPATPPVAANSALILADLIKQMEDNFGDPGRPNMALAKSSEGKNEQFSHTVVESGAGDPWVTITDAHQGDQYPTEVVPHRTPMWLTPDGTATKANGTGRFRIPADMPIPDGSDHGVCIYDRDADQYLEMWGAVRQAPDRISCAWGGFKQGTAGWDGRWDYPEGDPRHDSGTAAVGMALAGYVVRVAEWLNGRINHPVGFSTVNAQDIGNRICYPGTRHDGWTTGENILAEGQIVFLPRSVDLSKMHLHPMVRTLAVAAQEYGMISTDKGGSAGINCVNPSQFDEWRLGKQNILETRLMGPDSDPNSWFPWMMNGLAKDSNGVNYDPFPWSQMKVCPIFPDKASYDAAIPAPNMLTTTSAVEAVGGKAIPALREQISADIDGARGLALQALDTAKNAQPGSGAAADTTLMLTYGAATGKWTWVDANKVTQTLSASNQPAWSSYTNVLPMAPDVLDLSTVDMSLIPTQYPIFVPLSAADAAGLVTVEGGGTGNATMNPIPYTDLAVV